MGTYFSTAQNSEMTTWRWSSFVWRYPSCLVALFFKSVREVKCTDYQAVVSKQKKNRWETDKLGAYFDEAWEVDTGGCFEVCVLFEGLSNEWWYWG